MKRYRICCLEATGRIFRADAVHCHDDLAAMDVGQQLCANNAVEVWDESRLVARFEPGNPPQVSEDDQSL
jgi:hypothetical protein